MEVVALIPARYGSTRFPGKPLALLRGKPMIQHVYEQTQAVRNLARIIVATDDERIAKVIRAISGEVAMTRADHPTGTDRLAEAAERLSADIIVNVQGDLPFFPPAMVENAVTALINAPAAVMSTVRTPIYEIDEWHNINVVKVVTDHNGLALYFSRSPIPYDWGQGSGVWGQGSGRSTFNVQRPEPKSQIPNPKSQNLEPRAILGYRHIGLYAYRRDFLFTFTKLPRTPLEQTEQLEQLRALEWGYRITVSETERPTIEIDTPEDLRRAEEAMP
jgi:3-deoxy-manno-octulosonate cytidylyltransferase (CMP-KDO synthetase)